MIFLINCEVLCCFYNTCDTKEVNHVVEADTDIKALEKLKNYYLTKDAEYEIKYYVSINYCNSIIT